MFFDWLTMFQDHDKDDFPILSDRFEIVVDSESGEHLASKQPVFKHAGSFSTSISIRISGGRVTVKGNPSRINRLDNLFGYQSIDECVAVYNQILLGLGLPPFTKCTRIFHTQAKEGERALSLSDGATIQELHITTNRAVGAGNVEDYLKGLSTQRYKNSIPHLFPNGQTVAWMSKRNNASLIYPSVYCKAHEIELHQLPKIKKLHGESSPEYADLLRVIDYCKKHGVARFEQKLKSRFLRRNNFCFWGLFDESELKPLHDDFIKLDEKLKVNAMTYQSIAEQLREEEICKSIQASNATANYFFMWLHGQRFDLAKSQVKVHRARLRRIGVDIAEVCDTTKHSAVRVKEVREISVSDLLIPDWYELPEVNYLRLVA